MRRSLFFGVVATVCLCLAGCNSATTTDTNDAGSGPQQPFTLAWSEYPSWSVFGVAHVAGLIDADKGAKGKLEEKWGVDVVLKELDYEKCLAAYGNSTADAVCITNMDILAPAGGRNSVAILPTSTSDGADACIVSGGLASLADLKGKDSYGLEKSVSQYMFERALEELGEDPKEYPFRQMDPAAAAQAMQTRQDNINSIVVWNPFVIQTLRALEGDAKVLFDSKKIPEEIIDMVVIGEDALHREGGKAFAACIVEAFYEVNRMIASPTEGDNTLIALGSKFGGLDLEDMKVIVEQTRFYKTAEEGVALFSKPEFQTTLMPRVVDFCSTHGIIDEKPSISFDESSASLRFDTSFMQQANAGEK